MADQYTLNSNESQNAHGWDNGIVENSMDTVEFMRGGGGGGARGGGGGGRGGGGGHGGRGGGGHGHGGNHWHGGGRYNRGGWGGNYGYWGNYGGTFYPWYAYNSYYPYYPYTSYSYTVVPEVVQQSEVIQQNVDLGVCNIEQDNIKCVNGAVPVYIGPGLCQCKMPQQ